jgi:uncharacterized protein (DUF2132 family)
MALSFVNLGRGIKQTEWGLSQLSALYIFLGSRLPKHREVEVRTEPEVRRGWVRHGLWMICAML